MPAGDGPEELQCALARGWPFIQVHLARGDDSKIAGRRLTEIRACDVLSMSIHS